MADYCTILRRMNEVALRQSRLVLGWWPSLGLCPLYHHGICNQPTRSTQPCILPESLRTAVFV